MISKEIEKYCKYFTKIENYANAIIDGSQVWDCHHRLETHYLKDGIWIRRDNELSPEDLKKENKYFDVPPEELIFLTRGEHYNKELWHRKEISEEQKESISKALTGKPLSDERKNNISIKTKEAMQNLPDGWRTEEAKENARNARKRASLEYKEYKKNGGTMKWNEWNHFRKQESSSDNN